MWTSLHHFFASPVFPDSEEKSRKAQTLNVILNLQLLTLALMGSIGWTVIFTEKRISGIAIGISVGITLGLKALLNAKFLQLVTFSNGFIFWTTVTFFIYLSGGIFSPNVFFYLVIVIMVGLTIGMRWAIGYTILSILAMLGMTLVEYAGFSFPQILPLTLFAQWLLFALIMLWALVPLYFTIQQLDQAIQQAHKELRDRAQAEQTLRENEERYRLISSVSSDYMFSTQPGPDGQMHLEWVAGAFEKITGYTFEEFKIRGGWSTAVHPDDREQDAYDMEVLHNNQPVVTEVRILHKSGETRQVRVYAHPVWDQAQNTLKGIFGAVQDITDRKRAEEELRQSLAREQRRARQLASFNEMSRAVSELNDLPALMDIIYAQAHLSLPMGFFFIGLYDEATNLITFPIMYDEGRRWEQPPAEATEATFTGKTILSGKPILLNQWAETPHAFSTMVGDTAKTTVSLMFAPLTIGERVIGVISVQSYVRDAYDENDLNLLVGLAQQFGVAIRNAQLFESTRRQLDELTLLHGAALVSAAATDEDTLIHEFVRIVRSAFVPDIFGVALWDEKKNALFGHPASQGLLPEMLATPVLLGQGILGQVAQTLQPLRVSDVQREGRYIAAHPTIQAELCVPIAAGEHLVGVIDVESNRPNAYSEADERLLLTLAGQLATAIERLRAVDSLRQLNMDLEARVRERTLQLEDTNKELESFSYSVSHDLRAPLRGIDGFSTLLEQGYAHLLDEKGRHFLTRVRDSAHRMNQLINDLLTFSRLGRQELHKKIVNPTHLIQDVLMDLQSEFERHPIELLIAPDLPSCEADPGLLRQVFANLLGNALKYSSKREAPHIEISWLEQDGNIVYYVYDNGVGFNMEFADRLFGVFQRLHRADEFEGTGVGLATVHRIITRHGGRIWAKAEVDKGATFYFTLGTERPL